MTSLMSSHSAELMERGELAAADFSRTDPILLVTVFHDAKKLQSACSKGCVGGLKGKRLVIHQTHPVVGMNLGKRRRVHKKHGVDRIRPDVLAGKQMAEDIMCGPTTRFW